MKTAKGISIPKTMKAAVLTEFGKPFKIQDLPIPHPKKGQVLLKIHSSPINPSDFAFINGYYKAKKVPPVIPGFEGSGQVVATGSGYMSGRLLGKNVAGFAPMDGNGTWAEYMLTEAKLVVPVQKGLDLEQASMLFVNPLTAYAFVEIAKKRGLKSIANTAGASALGRMLQSMCVEKGIELVSIVRREEQKELLRNIGGKHIINSSSEDFESELSKKFHDLNVKLVFDAVAGELPESLLKALSSGGEVMVYGGLSQEEIEAEPGHFIFNDKKLTGFWLSKWITMKHPLQLLRIFPKIQKFLKKQHQIKINKRLSLDESYEGVFDYVQGMTKGKMIVAPGKK